MTGMSFQASAWRLAPLLGTRRTICIDQSAISPQSPVRPGGEFFTAPTGATQRRYEALRAYLRDGEPAAVVAQRFGYTTAALNSAVRDFRGGAQEFFLTATPGPKSAPGKDAARSRIIELRTDGHSIDEIAGGEPAGDLIDGVPVGTEFDDPAPGGVLTRCALGPWGGGEEELLGAAPEVPDRGVQRRRGVAEPLRDHRRGLAVAQVSPQCLIPALGERRRRPAPARRASCRHPPQRQTGEGPTGAGTSARVPPHHQVENRQRRPDQSPETGLRLG